MKRTSIAAVIMLLLATAATAAEVKFNPSWALLTKDGHYIDIVSLSTATRGKEVILLYKTISGKKGSLPAKKLANEKELVAALEEAIQNREAVHEQPYRPPQNWRIASSPQRAGGRSATGSKSIIVNNCKADWKDDYRMVEYCINEQTKALANIRRMSGPILEKCKQEWGHDYRMVEYCTNEQTGAKNRLDSQY